MDIYLTYKCDFFISTGGGLDGIAIIFDKPILYINYLPVAEWAVGSDKFLFSYKKYFDENEKKYLSLSKIFEKNLAYNYKKKNELNNMGLSLKNIDPNELKDIVLEMEKYYKHNNLTDLQNLFKKKFEVLINKYPNKENYFGKIFPRVSNKFLKKNPFYLD